jgi:EAL domain-containing protein (putative c-di-GMP-specific phosphodiesterase class I)
LRVNLSARQFERPDLVDTVSLALRESGLPPEALCLEITETVLMGNAPAALRTLTALKALGVHLAIDDFGIGYSSLAYLKRFPVDTLKIDRSFVEGLGTDPIDLPIVQAVLSLGRTLGLDVVAEGVETPLQEQTLKALGCDRVQGFLYARPKRPEDVPSLFTPA